MSKNILGEDSPIPKFIHLKIRRRECVESLTILEEGEFKLAIDDCIKPRSFQELCPLDPRPRGGTHIGKGYRDVPRSWPPFFRPVTAP